MNSSLCICIRVYLSVLECIWVFWVYLSFLSVCACMVVYGRVHVFTWVYFSFWECIWMYLSVFVLSHTLKLLKYTQIRSNTLMFSHALSHSLPYTHINSNTLKYTQRHSNKLKFTQINSNALNYTQIHSNTLINWNTRMCTFVLSHLIPFT